jgi:hypothetical protein
MCIVVAALPVGLDSSSTVLHPARGSRVVAPLGELPALIYSGAFHLALAIGRMRCLGRDRPVTDELRQLTLEDLARARRGVDAATACDEGRARLRPADPDLARLSTANEFGYALAQLREEARRALGKPICGRDARLVATLERVHRTAESLGSAAAQALCAIATWNNPLSADILPRVREDLERVRNALRGLRALPTEALVVRVAALSRRLSTASGEEIYHELLQLSHATEELLRGTSRTPKESQDQGQPGIESRRHHVTAIIMSVSHRPHSARRRGRVRPGRSGTRGDHQRHHHTGRQRAQRQLHAQGSGHRSQQRY